MQLNKVKKCNLFLTIEYCLYGQDGLEFFFLLLNKDGLEFIQRAGSRILETGIKHVVKLKYLEKVSHESLVRPCSVTQLWG